MSRTVQGRRVMGDLEKEVLRKLLWQVADFSGLNIITYCVMGNHFHVLVEVPDDQEEVADDELVRRFRVLYPKPTKHQPLTGEDVARLLAENEEPGEALRASLLSRMGDLSIFMKTLKQRYSVWYNQTHETFGAFWAERFKSVLLEGGFALQLVAAYIDLNPVRAALVKDPKDYRFCGYAEAVAGAQGAGVGVRRVMRYFMPNDGSGDALAEYREFLFGRGSQEVGGKAGISREDAQRVLEAGGALSVQQLLRCRIRFFTRGLVLGSEGFVRDWLRDPACGRTRRGRKRKLREAIYAPLSALRIVSGVTEGTVARV